MVLNFKLAAQGWDNLKKITEDGWNGLMGVLTPSGGDLVRQVKNTNTGPTPQIVDVVEETPKVIQEIPTVIQDIIPDSWSKYGKYIKWGAIGGAALLAYSVLKK